MIPSPLQLAIFEQLRNGTGNLLISACAGSGKTTTIVEGLKVLPVKGVDSFLPPKTLFLAFNKMIADTLQGRVPRHVSCSTFHSLGFRALKESGHIPERTGKDFVNGRKVAKMVYNMVGRESPDTQNIIKLVSLCKSRWPIAGSARDVEDVASTYDLDLLERESVGVVLKVLDKSSKDLVSIDSDDMLWLPVLLGCRFSTQDYVFVDEAQDTNDIQLEILARLHHGGNTMEIHTNPQKTRYTFVGDKNQAIYGFRGANADSMSKIESRFHCKSLPLDVSYRCPKKIVAEAQRWVG